MSTRESLGLAQYPSYDSTAESHRQDSKAINFAINRLAHTILKGGLPGFVRQPDAFIQHQVNQLLGPETVVRTTTYAGMFATIRHFNAVVTHDTLLAETYQLNPNALTLWMGLHHEDIDHRVRQPGLTPQQIIAEAQDHFHSHMPTYAHTDLVWQAFGRLNTRIMREIPHEKNQEYVNRVRLLCDFMAQTGATPPYSIAKRFTKGAYTPYHLLQATSLQMATRATLMAAALTRAERGSTLKQLTADMNNINRMLSCVASCDINGYDDLAVLHQTGIDLSTPANFATAWRILSAIARDYISIAGADSYPTPQTKAFFHYLRHSDLSIYDRHCPNNSPRPKRSRAVNARGHHLQQAIDENMLLRLQSFQMPYGLNTVPHQSVTLHVAGRDFIKLTKQPNGCIMIDADESYWLGQALPHPDSKHLENQPAAWTSRQSITIAVTSRIAEVLATHWPEIFDQGRLIKPPTADVVYRHRRGIEKLLPPHLAAALTADREISQNLHTAITQLLDTATYHLALSLTGIPPNIDIYNIVAAAGPHLAQTAASNPMAAVVYLWHNILEPDPSGAPQSAQELNRFTKRYLTTRGFPAQHWDKASQLSLADVQRALQTNQGQDHAVQRLLVMALAQVTTNNLNYDYIVADSTHFYRTTIKSFSPNYCHAAALACRHHDNQDIHIHESVDCVAAYVEYLDQNHQTLECTTWLELQQQSITHPNAQPAEELTQQWVHDFIAQRCLEQTWHSLLHEQSMDGYRVVPLNNQHQLLQQNWLHPESSIYYDHQHGFDGTARFFTVAHEQRPEERTSFFSIQRDIDHWSVRQTIAATTEQQADITHIAEQILHQYRDAYAHSSTFANNAGFWAHARTLPHDVRATLPEDILKTQTHATDGELPF